MAKSKKQEVEATEVETEVTEVETEQEATERKRARRGSTLTAQMKRHFCEIMGEFATSGNVNQSTLEDALPIFEQIPITNSMGLPIEVQLANIQHSITEMFESKQIDENELRKLLNRKARLEKALEVEELDESEDESEEDSETED